MLEKDPIKRIRLVDILNHDFFTNYEDFKYQNMEKHNRIKEI